MPAGTDALCPLVETHAPSREFERKHGRFSLSTRVASHSCGYKYKFSWNCLAACDNIIKKSRFCQDSRNSMWAYYVVENIETIVLPVT